MKAATLLLFVAITACTDQTDRQAASEGAAGKLPAPKADTPGVGAAADTSVSETAQPYSNARFRKVRVERTEEHKFKITGQARVFEAAFSWVIEDGHNELKQGHGMTDAGAPEWGNFSFVVEAGKERENSTLHLVLFEASAKDGSRQHQLPVPLY